MAYIATDRSAVLRKDRMPGIFAQLGAALARRRLYYRTVSELVQLSDRELADLGISRSSITTVAREAAYGN